MKNLRKIIFNPSIVILALIIISPMLYAGDSIQHNNQEAVTIIDPDNFDNHNYQNANNDDSDSVEIKARAPPLNGYTLYTPLQSTTTYLINMTGDVVHTWPSAYNPGLAVYLNENGTILRTGKPWPNPTFSPTGGWGGCIQEIGWDGNLLWQFNYSTADHLLHHDIEVLPNGNVLGIAWEYKTDVEAIDAGRNPSLLPENKLWPDHIIEIEPAGPFGGNIVWEWHAWDHLIQDYDISKDNYGVVADHPELLDINFMTNPGADWLHINSVYYNEEFDQIILSVHGLNEIVVIDHSTTTAEAASHSGGNSGKGGDILYRWGNPQAYDAGGPGDCKLFGQHDAQWIDSDSPGAGNILIFNNGNGRPEGAYSSVDEIIPPVDANGNYEIIAPGTPYGPEEPIWNYTASTPTDFYSAGISGAQRLPNGNTLICEGDDGYFFEITPENVTVWEYNNQLPSPALNNVFKCSRYPPYYPGLADLWNFSIPVSQGWNFISFPLIPRDNKTPDVIMDLEGDTDWTLIQYYDVNDSNDHWKSYSTFKPSTLNDLNSIDETMGFWIYVPGPIPVEGAFIKVKGSQPTSTNITLKAGWNMVGYPSVTERTISEALAGTGYDAIEGFNATAPYKIQPLQDSGIMKAGEGYWVHVPADTVWTVEW